MMERLFLRMKNRQILEASEICLCFFHIFLFSFIYMCKAVRAGDFCQELRFTVDRHTGYEGSIKAPEWRLV